MGFQLPPDVVGKHLGVAVEIGKGVGFLVDAGLCVVEPLPDDDGREPQEHRVQDPDDAIDESGHLVVELENLYAEPAPCQQDARDRKQHQCPNEEDSP